MESFVIYSNEIEERLDPLYLRYKSKTELPKYKFPLVSLESLLKAPPQYGANESAIEGDSEINVRYIRITDIDESGNLKPDEWKTANTIDEKYLLVENDILFARSGATAGKTFIYKTNVGKAIFAGYLIRFRIDESKANPDYIFYYTQLNTYANWVKSIQRPAGQPNINSEEFKSIQIPLPPLAIQNKIVAQIQDGYRKTREMHSKAEQQMDSIDGFVLDALGLKLPELKTEMYFTISNKEIEGRIDPFFYSPPFEFLLKELRSIKHKELNELIHFSNESWNQEDFFNERFPYIEISEIDILSGTIKNVNYVDKKDAPSRARMIVRKNDIIISTTRPHRGAICFIDQEKDGFIASTGFAILRDCKTNDITKEFLHTILRNKICLYQMLQRSSGGNYPAIATEELKNILIPLPTIEIQNKITQEVKSKMKKAEAFKQEAKIIIEQTRKEVERAILG